MRQNLYILDENRNPRPASGVGEWAAWFETADRRVARTSVGKGIDVSTAFLALDHNFSEIGPPLLYETMVFGGPHHGRMARCATEAEAHAQHSAFVRFLTGEFTEEEFAAELE